MSACLKKAYPCEYPGYDRVYLLKWQGILTSSWKCSGTDGRINECNSPLRKTGCHEVFSVA